MKTLKSFLPLLLIFLSTGAFGQPTLALGPLQNSARIDQGLVRSLESAILEGIRESGTCEALERIQWEVILAERDIQKTEDFINEQVVRQGASKGANHLLFLDFQAYTINDRYKDSRNFKSRKVEATLRVMSKLVSVETGEVLEAKLFALKANKSFGERSDYYDSPDKVVMSSVNNELLEDLPQRISAICFRVFSSPN